LLAVVCVVGIGCASNALGAEKGDGASAGTARELAMRPLPTYRIAPPDVLSIEVLKLVPPPPYRATIYDTLQIRVVGALMDQPIDGFFLVESDGDVTLGPSYGRVHVAGMTMPEAQAAVMKNLKQVLAKPQVSVQLAKSVGCQAVTGDYLVAPDGTINLRKYGRVQVTDKTVEEASAAVQKRLAKFFDAPDVSLDIKQCNSKVFYIITEGAGMGDNVRRVPITGNDTVLDALAAVNGLSQVSSKRIWIARPSAKNPAKGTILPVDYAGITKRGATATNYQIMPGDRVFIAQDKTVALNEWISKKTAPIERVLGIISLGASIIENVEKVWPKSPDDPPTPDKPEP
jgi:polysaccharide export outer membrane protein